MQKKETIKGKITVTSSGSGFLDRQQQESIYIPLQSLNTALNGDEVEVALIASVPGERIQGEVVEVIQRNKKQFVGTINRKTNSSFAFLLPDDSRMYSDIFIPNVSSQVKNNYKALVEITNWQDHKKNPQGKILKIIGKKGNIDAEMESIVIEKGFQIAFPDLINKEAQEIKKKNQLMFQKEKNKRKDFTNIFTLTIDPKDAKDFDDAISFKKINKNLYQVGIHIADVGFYVKEKSLIDKEARKRSFSLYLVDRTIPMLPEILSNDICSLNPGQEKLAFSVVFEITSEAIVRKTNFIKTVIKSNKRLSYEKAQKLIDNKNCYELETLLNITQKLREKRIEQGALNISQEEINVEIDKKGKPINIYIKKPLETHNLIEELMILANKEVATYFSKKKNFCLFRIHDKPDKDSIDDLYRFLQKIGHNPQKKQKLASSQELNDLIKAFENKDEEFLVKSILIRSLPKAIYSIDNKGHFALAINNYTHFTSPIRRYADLIVHRALVKSLDNVVITKKEKVFFKKVAEQINKREIESASAERESVATKQVEYMLQKIGNTYKGIITGVTQWGIYVSELETKAEGMVRLRDMKDDFYYLDKESFSIIGTRNKKKYSLGTKVRIKVIDGDPDKKTLDYKFI